jgi:hypothetical protein
MTFLLISSHIARPTMALLRDIQAARASRISFIMIHMYREPCGHSVHWPKPFQSDRDKPCHVPAAHLQGNLPPEQFRVAF